MPVVFLVARVWEMEDPELHRNCASRKNLLSNRNATNKPDQPRELVEQNTPVVSSGGVAFPDLKTFTFSKPPGAQRRESQSVQQLAH